RCHRQITVSATPEGRLRERVARVELDGRLYEVKALVPEPPFAELARRRRERTGHGAHHGAAKDAVVTPMQGTVLAVEVADGNEVQAGQVICIVEAMKMENEITAHRDGVVTDLSVVPGQPVTTGQVVCVIAQAEARSSSAEASLAMPTMRPRRLRRCGRLMPVAAR